jgi:hypothetical protein
LQDQGNCFLLFFATSFLDIKHEIKKRKEKRKRGVERRAKQKESIDVPIDLCFCGYAKTYT